MPSEPLGPRPTSARNAGCSTRCPCFCNASSARPLRLRPLRRGIWSRRCPVPDLPESFETRGLRSHGGGRNTRVPPGLGHPVKEDQLAGKPGAHAKRTTPSRSPREDQGQVKPHPAMPARELRCACAQADHTTRSEPEARISARACGRGAPQKPETLTPTPTSNPEHVRDIQPCIQTHGPMSEGCEKRP